METQRIALFSKPEPDIAYLIPFPKPGAAGTEIGVHLSIGRDLSCGLVINDEFVSMRHARVERRTGGFIIRDLHSRNGTFLNGSRVNEAILTTGDRIRFGESVFVFSSAPSDSPALESKNETWKAQLERVSAFSATEFPVLITGPSGSGKEILARQIHARSSREKGPFVSINCSALSEGLIESELFGHIRGSFTGATHDRKGAFESARGGTLFLDEIGDLPLTLQPKLLRALENNEIRPVGADRSIETDVRIVAATHKNLPAQVKQGRFREDLYYRINVCKLSPPALKDRMEDFDDLIYQFAKHFRVRFSFTAIEKLKEYRWPGNIRELKNLVARASAYYPGRHIRPEDIAGVLQSDVQPIAAADESFRNAADLALSVGTNGSVIKEFEKEMIIQRLLANNGNQRRTAQDLGMPKSTLHDRLKTYSIDLRQFDENSNEGLA